MGGDFEIIYFDGFTVDCLFRYVVFGKQVSIIGRIKLINVQLTIILLEDEFKISQGA